jgi:uncharacterized glyoxalase superfamily protein PhnB
VVPIVADVADVAASCGWFAKLDWRTHFEWCDERSGQLVFAGIKSGDFEIFMCRDDQGGRDENGAWISVWVDDVDAVHERAAAEGVDVIRAPADEPWEVREFHVLHPDGHVLRISQEIKS